MATKSSSPVVPCAFGIRLGIVTGRTSPDPEAPTIMVNAETTVNWIFLQAAYIHSRVHGRDNTTLQDDFDLVLLRPGGDDIILCPSRVIADYKVGRNDLIELRHKTLPIPVYINLFVGGDRKIEVNSGFPLIDVVPNICQKIGIKNYDELSLALATSAPGRSTMQYGWLNIDSSLRGQGVQDGDTVLLRKKFFILNDDIIEALEGNEILEELIYEQIKEMYTTENYVCYEQRNMAVCAKLTGLLHCIEQHGGSINGKESVRSVTPKLLKENSEFYWNTVSTYSRERVGILEAREAKKLLLQFFASPQSVLVNFFPVKMVDDGLQSQEHILLVDSKMINVCPLVKDEQEKLKCAEGMSWRLKDLRDVSEKDRYLRINILGTWFKFTSDCRTQISCYLMEAGTLTKQSVFRQRTTSSSSYGDEQPALNGRMDLTITPKPKTAVNIEVVEELASNAISEEEKQESITPQPSNYTLVTGNEGTEEVEAEELRQTPKELSENEEACASTETFGETGNDLGELGSFPHTMDKQSSEELRSSASPSPSSLLPPFPLPRPATPTPPFANGDSNSSPTKTSTASSPYKKQASPIKLVEAGSLSKLAEARSLSKSLEMLSMTKSMEAISCASSYIHIPEFFDLDFREVLEDYRLFQIVVMKRDVRSILLNIKKPVEEVITSICQMFDIPDSGNHYLWIPTGIQKIIEKYRGRPKSRIGKFIKRGHARGSFAPRLDQNRSLQDQYNFNIRPFLLHLRHYQVEEEIDGSDFEAVYAGQEWPENGHPEVARRRKFYQSWIGVIQGIYPIERRGAVKMAALLTQIYFGAREENPSWPPFDYNVKTFLPETHKHSYGIISEVERAYQEQGSLITTEDCINDLIQSYEKLSTMNGVFFEVAEPVKSDILKVIPWNRMERRWFGISINGIFIIDMETEEMNFCYDLSEIFKGSHTESSFKLVLPHGVEFDAYTYQAKEILDTLNLFIQIKQRRNRLIAPDKPLTRIITVPTKCGSSMNDGSLDGSPIDGRSMLPFNLRVDNRQAFMSPTTYDL